MTLNDLRQTLIKLDCEGRTSEELADLLIPFFESVDFQNRSLLIKVPTDNLPSDAINRLYAYADWLRHLGAKNVVFLPKGSEVGVMDFSKDQHYSLKVSGEAVEKVHDILDWLRIAGADPEKIMVLGPGCGFEGS